MAKASFENKGARAQLPDHYILDQDQHAALDTMAEALIGLANIAEDDDSTVTRRQLAALLGAVSIAARAAISNLPFVNNPTHH